MALIKHIVLIVIGCVCSIMSIVYADEVVIQHDPVHVVNVRYTGFWKVNCSNGYGVQIMSADKGLYSISFCGPGGCFDPGRWTPNSAIDGDPAYQVISPKEIKIKNSTYMKCTDDPTWVVEKRPVEQEKELDCSIKPSSKEEGVLIAWTTDVRTTTQFGGGSSEEKTTVVGSFRPLALLNGSSLTESLGSWLYKDQPFWNILSPTSGPLKLSSVDSFVDHMNDTHCVYYGTLNNTNLPKWTLLSSKPLPDVFHPPTQNDLNEFYKLNTKCVEQGDYPEGKQPPCTKPQLLAISDINKNGKPEYWATEPYMWDTGLTVWESDNGKLIELLSICVGCSD